MGFIREWAVAILSRRSRLRATAHTVAPRRARAIEVAAPMPIEAPVTTTVRRFRCMTSLCCHHVPDIDGSSDEVVVTELTEVTQEMLDGWKRLMPQLSSSAPPPDAAWLNEIIHSDSIMFVASLNDQVVGFLTLVLTRIPVGLKAWIEDVVVDEQHRGRRIGEKLTVAAIERAKRENARNINLESRPSRLAAHKLYKRVGFEERETTVYRYKG